MRWLLDTNEAIRIKTPDALIAATAVIHQAEVVTRNITDFKRVASLAVVDPATL